MRRDDLLLSNVERVVPLRDVVGFEALGGEALGAIARLATRRTYAAGTTILRADEPRTATQILLGGDLAYQRMGRRWPIQPGRRVLDLLWLARDTMPLVARTEEGADVLELPLDRLDEILEEHFAVWLASAQGLARWLLSLAPPSPESTTERRAMGTPLRLSERVVALQQALAFGRGYVDALLQLEEEATVVRHDAGSVLWRPGDAATHLLVPLDGAVRGVTADDPCGVGGLELLAGRPRVATLEVVRPLTALRVEREALLDLVEDHHELARDLLAMLAASVVQSIADAR